MTNFFKSVIALVAIFSVQFVSAQDRIITFGELPAKAQAFVREHFAEGEVAGVYEDTEYLVQKEYSVYLNNATEIEFYANGDWEEVKSRMEAVPNKIVPTAILQHVQKHFPNTFIKEIKKRRVGYEVEISNGLDLEFNSAGRFIRIDD